MEGLTGHDYVRSMIAGVRSLLVSFLFFFRFSSGGCFFFFTSSMICHMFLFSKKHLNSVIRHVRSGIEIEIETDQLHRNDRAV